MKKILYTDEPKEISTLESCGMIFAMVMLFIVLPVAICILTAGF